MDVTIPSHRIKTFANAIAALNKVSGSSKDLYLDFDMLEGLFLRAINDAKSAYIQFHFEAGYFERCSTSLESLQSRKRKVDENSSQRDNFSCRIPVRSVSSILHNRKGVQSLRIRYEGEKDEDGHEKSAYSMQLSFEFALCAAEDSGYYRIVHRIGVADARGVQAVAPKDDCSEIVVRPNLLLKLIEPLKKTNEVAFTVNGSSKVATATSFHHGDTVSAANQLTSHVLKTETSIGCEEFDRFEWIDNRLEDDNLPESVNDEVILVFSLKETKAMVQFCCQQVNEEEEAAIVVSFHWGGQPITFELEGNAFSAQLILATLDHKLLQKRVGQNA